MPSSAGDLAGMHDVELASLAGDGLYHFRGQRLSALNGGAKGGLQTFLLAALHIPGDDDDRPDHDEQGDGDQDAFHCRTFLGGAEASPASLLSS